MLGKFTHFVSRKSMNIEGLSEKTLEALISHDFIHNYKDIYHLNDHQAKLIRLDGMGKKSVLNMLSSIENSREVTLDRFICALGIPNIGSSASKTLAKLVDGDYDRFIKAYKDCFDWTLLDDFGVTMAASLERYLDENFEMVNALAAEMHFQQKVQISNEKTSKKVKDLNFCITGSLVHYSNRDELVAAIEANGGKFVSSVSKKCNYLINNDVESNSSKNKKAKECGVSIITEEEFMEMIK